ncbi:adhesion G protein-coupled receptor B2 [Elysia marginata]|uniref:Adhesion G protein-coupled receptor B2 n=1 Tax=Elysia marginata TaxID=1093978 RepID=A0AAV4JGY2_9GAST|nr:adhesion G protein-coupled receptor B2 [Elysia marginata]
MLTPLFNQLQIIAWILFLFSFAFDILCVQNESNYSRFVNSSAPQKRWPNKEIKEIPVLKKPRFKCDFTSQCWKLWVLEPACSDGYLKLQGPRPGYIRVSFRGSNSCPNNSLSFSLGWLWASASGNSREIRRCREMWTCLVPLKAILPSKLVRRWLDVVVSTNKNSTEDSIQVDFPFTISLRTNHSEKKNKAQIRRYKFAQKVIRWAEGFGHKDNVHHTKRGSEKLPLSDSSVSEPVKSKLFSTQEDVDVQLEFTPIRVSRFKKIIQRLSRPIYQKLSNNDRNIRTTFTLKHTLENFKKQNTTRKSQTHYNDLRNLTWEHNRDSKQVKLDKNHSSLPVLSSAQPVEKAKSLSVGNTLLKTLTLLLHRDKGKSNISNLTTHRIDYDEKQINFSTHNFKTGQISLSSQTERSFNQTPFSYTVVSNPDKTLIGDLVNLQEIQMPPEYLNDQKQAAMASSTDEKPALLNHSIASYPNLNPHHNYSSIESTREGHHSSSTLTHKAIPTRLQHSGKLSMGSGLRVKRSIRGVDDDEAADIAVLMNGESKEDRKKIATMIASDFESTAGLSNPVVTRKHWKGGSSSKISRAKDNAIREMDHLINVLEDEEVKVSSNLPVGDGDQEDLLVEIGSQAHLAKMRHQIKTKMRKLEHAKKALNKANLLSLSANVEDMGKIVPGEIIVEKNELKATVSDLESSLQRLRDRYSDLIKEKGNTPDEFRKLNGVVTIDPVWSLWSAWSSCSADCTKGGYSFRRRSCDTMPSVPCPGSNFDMKMCNQIACEGHWIAWGNWGPCSVTCGKGVRARSRVCVGGHQDSTASCPGRPAHSIVCDQLPCPTVS